MKIAFDEHIPIQIANALKELDGENQLLRSNIVSARDYAIPNAESDVPWLERFASDGGRIIISGDAKMRGKLHEQAALVKAGFIVFFWARKWNQQNGYDKTAMMIKWWPHILLKLQSAKSGQFFELSYSWTSSDMKEVTPPTEAQREIRKKHDKAVR